MGAVSCVAEESHRSSQLLLFVLLVLGHLARWLSTCAIEYCEQHCSLLVVLPAAVSTFAHAIEFLWSLESSCRLQTRLWQPSLRRVLAASK
jgi:hypothetical protein